MSPSLLNATLDAYGKAGLLGNLRNALQRFKSFNLTPDLTRYATGAPDCCLGPRGVPVSGPVCAPVLYRTVLYCRMCTVLYCMVSVVCSYNILVHAYGMSGMLAEMEETVRQLRDAGHTPDQYTL